MNSFLNILEQSKKNYLHSLAEHDHYKKIYEKMNEGFRLYQENTFCRKLALFDITGKKYALVILKIYVINSNVYDYDKVITFESFIENGEVVLVADYFGVKNDFVVGIIPNYTFKIEPSFKENYAHSLRKNEKTDHYEIKVQIPFDFIV